MVERHRLEIGEREELHAIFGVAMKAAIVTHRETEAFGKRADLAA